METPKDTILESIILKGDVSGMSPEQRTRYYVTVCEHLGLNPYTQPLAIIRLNGRDVLYPTRGATDQLAAMHRLSREIVDGPEVRDFGGVKMIYAKCRATHPDGRTETAVATLPLNDLVMGLMKAETKSKRRATLSILGLGMLDETEIESIDVRYKERSPPVLGPNGTDVRGELTAPEEQPVVDTASKREPLPVQQERPAPTPGSLADRVLRAESAERPWSALVSVGREIVGDAQAITAWGGAVARQFAKAPDVTTINNAAEVLDRVPREVRDAVRSVIEPAYNARVAALGGVIAKKAPDAESAAQGG